MTASAYPIGPRLFLTASCHACDIPTKHTRLLSFSHRPLFINLLLRSPSVNVVAARDAALLSTTILILFYRNSNPPEWAYNTRFPNAIIHVDGDEEQASSLVPPLFVPRIFFFLSLLLFSSLPFFRKITKSFDFLFDGMGLVTEWIKSNRFRSYLSILLLSFKFIEIA